MIKVAIIDDNESVRNTISNVLSTSGIDVTAFDSALHFLKSARTDDFQIMLVDNHMPVMTGRELFYLVNSKKYKFQKFILMSGAFSPGEIETSHIAENPILLTKPFRLSQLLKLLQN